MVFTLHKFVLVIFVVHALRCTIEAKVQRPRWCVVRSGWVSIAAVISIGRPLSQLQTPLFHLSAKPS
ncbi:hypothetical protein AMTRI_Chr11g154300 [Amborella trichopoda]